MVKAMDVANFFVNLFNDDPQECMTNLRLNKLLYFAQAWSLARLDKPLFDEEIQAWDYGPVIPEVYKAFRPCGRDRIADQSGDYSQDVFTSDQLQLLLDVLNEYGKYATSGLVSITHETGSPWESVYEQGKNNVITKQSMKEYFKSQEPLKPFDDISLEEDYVGYRNEDGILVLPKEYDE